MIICANGLSYGINRYVLVPIQDQLIDWYNLLMTLYSWPNVLFSMICGILIDKFSNNWIMYHIIQCIY